MGFLGSYRCVFERDTDVPITPNHQATPTWAPSDCLVSSRDTLGPDLNPSSKLICFDRVNEQHGGHRLAQERASVEGVWREGDTSEKGRASIV